MIRALSLLLILTSLGLVVGCSPAVTPVTVTPPAGSEFAIYLTAQNPDLVQLPDPSRLELSPAPLLSLDDIIFYSSKTHQIQLTQAAVERFSQLDLPGQAFVVTAEGKPIYAGRFMAAYFSRSDSGVVILWPPMNQPSETIQIQLGYPGPSFFTGQDPRSDPRIMSALQQAGKLR
jgi:hypothetical protein